MSDMWTDREPDWLERAASYVAILRKQGTNKRCPQMSFEMRALAIAFSQELDKRDEVIRRLDEQVSRLTKQLTRHDPE